MIKVSEHRLDFGGIDLAGRVDYGGYKFYALAEGATLGNPVPITREVITKLLDGTFAVTDGHDNREPGFRILIEADNSILIERGQAQLFMASNQEAVLGYAPPDGWGPRMLLRAYTSTLQWVFDDLDELGRGGKKKLVRAFDLRMNCDPWRYAEEQVTVVASTTAPVTPSTTTISDGTSTTGWASPVGAAAQPTVVSGKLKIASRTSSADSPYVSEATRTLTATDFSGTPFITAELKAATGMRFSPILEGSAGVQYQQNDSGDQTLNWGGMANNPAAWAGAYVDGVRLSLVTYQTLLDGTVRYTWRCHDTSGTLLRFVAGTEESTESAVTPANGGFLLDNVTRSNVNPAASTSGRQSLSSVFADGSARTAPRFAIEHETSALGEVWLYTTSARGWAGFGGPSLRPFITLGALTTDTGTISGAYARMNADSDSKNRYSVPASLLPAGTYLIAMRARTGTGASGKVVQTTVSQIEGTTEFGEIVLPGTVVTGAAGTWSPITVLGAITLPRQKAPVESAAAVQFESVNIGAETGTWDVDDILIFPLGEGSDLTRVDCGTGSPSLGLRHNRLWLHISSPMSIDPGLYVGTLPLRADAFDPGYPAVAARGSHPLVAGANKFFVITTGARNPTITVTYTPASF